MQPLWTWTGPVVGLHLQSSKKTHLYVIWHGSSQDRTRYIHWPTQADACGSESCKTSQSWHLNFECINLCAQSKRNTGGGPQSSSILPSFLSPIIPVHACDPSDPIPLGPSSIHAFAQKQTKIHAKSPCQISTFCQPQLIRGPFLPLQRSLSGLHMVKPLIDCP